MATSDSLCNNLPFMQFDDFSLRFYHPSEIRKLSVIEITESQTFDKAGFSTKNGLYDGAMGCTEHFTSCETCGLKSLHCPGHFGHIQLSVPVFNPLLVQFTFNLMKGSCVHCHRFTCSTKDKNSELFLNKLGHLDNDASKSTVTLKHSIMKEYLREILCKRKTRCPHCKRGNGALRNDAGRAFILDFTKKSTGANKIKETKLAMKQETERKKKIVRSMEQPEVEIDEGEDEKKPDVKDGNVLSALNGSQTATSVLDPIQVSERMLSNQLSYVLDGKCDKLIWRAAEVREHFRILWHKEGALLKNLFPMFEEVENGYPVDLLFCESILVQPSKFRPIRFLKGEKFEHPITANYRNVLEADQLLTLVRIVMNKSSSSSILAATEMIEQRVQGKTLNEKLHNAYIQLQTRVNCLYDQEAIKGADIKFPGLKQILEKKEGLFRMNMMGKRVNYACRSVITPDPYLDVDEIGIPELFARKLTFAEPTNIYNTPNLRDLIRRGPLQHPGANFVQAHGHYSKQVLPTKPEDRSTFAQRIVPGGMNNANAQPTLVFRHLDRGDCLLMNRQPSLHKPSIMGHRARILKGQNALRMNYAPCKAYNADFDGDEMNGHFPQNRIAQTEIEEIANVGNNYLVPKDGTPILGLIQDHVVSGVLMTLRDRFFKKEDFMHLIFSAFAETTKRINVPLPAIARPEVLWSGKQVITAIVQHFMPSGCPKINLQGKSKTPLACWKVPGHDGEPSPEMSESEVIFRNGELLCGVLDKQHYGTTQYGLIHCCYELYGQKVAADILSCFSRVFTTYLQTHGFTLGVADILVTESADKIRRRAIKQIRSSGSGVVKKAFNLPDNASSLQIKHVMATAYNNPRKDKTDVKQLDYTMKQTTAKLSDEITKACVPRGLIRCFPQNALQMMIQSGAKGSMVNSIQISCALGQIELEGQRPPLSAVGRTLPSFRCFDPSPRAGGFVDQRFLTGLNPQELFFHTMAGREGLVDTAVKTSRSGYLQRCVIKHLEGLSVKYDNTVRDHDNSVIQFRYGEDGLDVGKATFLSAKQFPFLEDNTVALRRSAVGSEVCDSEWNVLSTEKQFRKCMRWNKKVRQTGKLYESAYTNYCNERITNCVGEKPSKDMLVQEWNSMTDTVRDGYEPKKYLRPVDVKYNPVRDLGAMPEKILEEIAQYCKKREDISEDFKRALYWKGLRSMADPGENVGLLAAQSIGEPSTQMTLNTFHFAGRGEMNVTLGIPRLREILMTAGKNIATPMAEITVLDGTPQEVIDQLKNDFNPVYLKQVIKKFSLEEKITLSKSESCRHYVLKIVLLKRSKRELSARHVSRKEIMRELEKRFAKSVADCIGKRYRDVLSYEQIRHKRLKQTNLEAGLGEDENEKQQEKDGADGTDDEADGGNEADADEAKLNRRHHDDAEYEGEDDEQDEVQEKLEPSGVLDEMEEIMNNSEEEDNPDVNEDENENGEINKSKGNDLLDTNRVADVLKAHPLIEDYHYDAQDEKWCSITFQLPLKNKGKLDTMAIVESEINKFVVKEVPGIEKCIVRNESKNGREVTIIQTQGINIEALYRRSDILDVNSFYSNDINRMLSTYGIEACGRTIVKEMNNVFGVYGIEVNPRHLSLTADYMTFTGEVQPFSRGAMAHCASPLQRMTFETTVTFMRDSIIHGEADNLISPSARLVTGQLQRTGTGSFDLLAEPRYMTDMSGSTTRMILQTAKKQKRKNLNDGLDDGEKRKRDL